jgi:hypothetical protein
MFNGPFGKLARSVVHGPFWLKEKGPYIGGLIFAMVKHHFHRFILATFCITYW